MCRFHGDKIQVRSRKTAACPHGHHSAADCSGENMPAHMGADRRAAGSDRSFKKIQPTTGDAQAPCTTGSGARHPVPARAITKSDGCCRWREKEDGTGRCLQRPADSRKGSEAVGVPDGTLKSLQGLFAGLVARLWQGDSGSRLDAAAASQALLQGVRGGRQTGRQSYLQAVCNCLVDSPHARIRKRCMGFNGLRDGENALKQRRHMFAHSFHRVRLSVPGGAAGQRAAGP